MAGFGKVTDTFDSALHDPLPARLPRSAVRRTYTWIAPFHDILARLVESRPREALVEMADVRDGEQVLEVGVGTGLTFECLVAKNPTGRTVGIDATPAMLARAARRLRAVPHPYQLQAGSAFDLDFEDGAFDLVVSTYMLDMYSETDAASILSEFHRVLRPGGRIALCHMTVPRTSIQAIWDRIYALHPPLLGGCRGIRLGALVGGLGFAPPQVRHISYRTFPSELLIAVRQ